MARTVRRTRVTAPGMPRHRCLFGRTPTRYGARSHFVTLFTQVTRLQFGRRTVRSMQITHLGHACLLVESADVRGPDRSRKFHRRLHALRDLHVIVVTHQHRDHLDPERLPGWSGPTPMRSFSATPTVSRCCEAWGWSPAFTSRDGTLIGDLTITPSVPSTP